jgi:hypothetical protein
MCKIFIRGSVLGLEVRTINVPHHMRGIYRLEAWWHWQSLICSM